MGFWYQELQLSPYLTQCLCARFLQHTTLPHWYRDAVRTMFFRVKGHPSGTAIKHTTAGFHNLDGQWRMYLQEGDQAPISDYAGLWQAKVNMLHFKDKSKSGSKTKQKRQSSKV